MVATCTDTLGSDPNVKPNSFSDSPDVILSSPRLISAVFSYPFGGETIKSWVYLQLTFIPIHSALSIIQLERSSVYRALLTAWAVLVDRCLVASLMSTASTRVVSSTYLKISIRKLKTSPESSIMVLYGSG